MYIQNSSDAYIFFIFSIHIKDADRDIIYNII